MITLISAFGSKPIINIRQLKLKFTAFQLLVHIGALIPFVVLIWDYNTDNLTVNPIQEATIRTGKTALILLVLSLACTPLNTVFKFRPVLKVRRSLGVYTGLYVTMHFLIFVWADYGLKLELIYEAIFEKRYALVGFSAFLILLPLMLTSTKGWQRRLGKRWKSLHRWVYLAGLLVVVHYVWLVKSDYREPLVYGAIIVTLLMLRVPAVKQRIHKVRSWRRKIRAAKAADPAQAERVPE